MPMIALASQEVERDRGTHLNEKRAKFNPSKSCCELRLRCYLCHLKQTCLFQLYLRHPPKPTCLPPKVGKKSEPLEITKFKGSLSSTWPCKAVEQAGMSSFWVPFLGGVHQVVVIKKFSQVISFTCTSCIEEEAVICC